MFHDSIFFSRGLMILFFFPISKKKKNWSDGVASMLREKKIFGKKNRIFENGGKK